MRSFTFNYALKVSRTFASHSVHFLRKKPEGPWRDPLTVICHSLFIAVWLAVLCFYWAQLSWAARLYFTTFFGLYVSSGVYHYFTKTKLLWTIDQIAIGIFIIAITLPFTTNVWVWGVSGFLVAATAAMKIYEAEQVQDALTTEKTPWTFWEQFGSYFHLGLGVWSAGVMVFVAFPEMGVGWSDPFAVTVRWIVLLFLTEWAIYHWDIEDSRLADWFGSNELKHFAGAIAKCLTNLLVLGLIV